jgi:hydroxymethylbilane synthase
VAEALRAGGRDAELVTITTSGDRTPGGKDRPTDKSRFVKEIEEALIAREIDLAVHSAKDVPGVIPEGLEIGAVPAAEDPRDALVGGASLDELAEGARVGTSSLRRRSLLHALRPDLEVVGLRGNVDTRLRKLSEGAYDAIVLALAGLRRLGRESEGAPLAPGRFVPAPGHGALALEVRIGDEATIAAIAPLEDRDSRLRVACERAVVAGLDTSCRTPVGAHAIVTADRLEASAYVGLPDGSEWITDRVEGGADDPEALGARLAERMLAAGASEILRSASGTLDS